MNKNKNVILTPNTHVILTPKAEGSRPKFSHVVLGSIVLLLAACGDEVTEVTEVTQVVGMQVVEEGDALPKCTTENEGQMVYSVDSAAAYYCVNRKWTSMKGKDGKDGKDGAAGKDGKDGVDGKDGTNGTDGTNGSDGTSCTAVVIENGYKIVCGEDSVGVVLNGQDGVNGTNGTDGTDGKDGTNGNDGQNCEIVSDTKGVLTLKCGDDTTTLYKAMCDLTPYDPMKQYCSLQGVFNLRKCGEKLYNPESHFCDARDSSIYRYVAIDSLIWMAENLNYKVDSSFCYNGSVEYCEKYGRLYMWAAAVGKSEEECGYGYDCELSGKVCGVCPKGWHLPDNSEWKALLAVFGEIASGGGMSGIGAYWNENAGVALKSKEGWSGSGNATDYFGFSALPAGSRGGIGSDGVISSDAFNGEGRFAGFWSSTESGSDRAFYMYMSYDNDEAFLGNTIKKNYANSVRCIKD